MGHTGYGKVIEGSRPTNGGNRLWTILSGDTDLQAKIDAHDKIIDELDEWEAREERGDYSLMPYGEDDIAYEKQLDEKLRDYPTGNISPDKETVRASYIFGRREAKYIIAHSPDPEAIQDAKEAIEEDYFICY